MTEQQATFVESYLAEHVHDMDSQEEIERLTTKAVGLFKELIDAIYEIYPEGFSSMPEPLENIMTKILLRVEDGELPVMLVSTL